MNRYAITGLAAVLASCAAAQETAPVADATAQAQKPCSSEQFKQFDFWVGEWEVFNASGPQAGDKAGDNIISKEEYGCLLIERWTDVQGVTGQSYNFVDHGSGKWRQLWVSAGAVIDYEGGLNDDGEMHLEGTIAYPNGVTAPFTGTWTPQDNGDVRQHFKQYNAQADKWNDWFIGTYKKKSAAE